MTEVTSAAARTEADLVDLAGLALKALDADRLVVIDRSRGHHLTVIDESVEGSTSEAVELPLALDDAETVIEHRTPTGGSLRIYPTPLEDERGAQIGALYTVYSEPHTDQDANQRSTLMRVFARHIFLGLAHGALRHETDKMVATLQGITALDELPRMPEAMSCMTDRVTAVVRPLIGATKACISLWDKETDILRPLPGAFGATDRDLASMTGPVTDLRSISVRVLKSGQPYMSNSAEGDPGILQSYVDIYGLRRMLSIPLVVGREKVGVLHLANKPTDFTVEDVVLAERLAPRIAAAVEVAELLDRVTTKQNLEAILSRTAAGIASGRDIADILVAALREFGEIADASMVALVPGRSDPLCWRRDDHTSDLEERFLADARGLLEGSVGAYPHAAGDPGWAATHMPVELYGETRASLSVLRDRGQPFGSDETEALSRLASLAALASVTAQDQRQRAELTRLQERHRIADELHDRVAQIFFAAQVGLDSVLEGGSIGPVDRERVGEVRGLLIRGDACIREVIHHLAPPPRRLGERLHSVIDEVEDHFGVVVGLDIRLDDPEVLDRISTPVADCMLRIVREATVNAAKHAGTYDIDVVVRAPTKQKLTVTVVDGGIGIDPAQDFASSHGVRSMRRAAGAVGAHLQIANRSGRTGTVVTATLPVAEQAGAARTGTAAR